MEVPMSSWRNLWMRFSKRLMGRLRSWSPHAGSRIHVPLMPSESPICRPSSIFPQCGAPDLVLWMRWEEMSLLGSVLQAGKLGTHSSTLLLACRRNQGPRRAFLDLSYAALGGGCEWQTVSLSGTLMHLNFFLLQWSHGTSLETWTPTNALTTVGICLIKFPRSPHTVAKRSYRWLTSHCRVHSKEWSLCLLPNA